MLRAVADCDDPEKVLALCLLAAWGLRGFSWPPSANPASCPDAGEHGVCFHEQCKFRNASYRGGDAGAQQSRDVEEVECSWLQACGSGTQASRSLVDIWHKQCPRTSTDAFIVRQL